jgi:hypothetical protein
MARIAPADTQLLATVNVFDPEKGKQHVEVYIRVESGPEGAMIGLAVDGSNSMKESFGAHVPPVFRTPEMNIMQPVVTRLASFLRGLSGDGKVHLIYWAVGQAGAETEPIGAIDQASEGSLKIEGPKKKGWGPGTKLAPPLKQFADQFKDAKWSLVVFITDGAIEDIEDVKKVSLELGKQIAQGKRKYLKLVIIGVGRDVDVGQMDDLNDMFEGTGLADPDGNDIDMWDGRLASDMQSLWDVLGEVDFGITLPGSARILSDKGTEVCSYSDGIPMKMDFEVPAGTKQVTIEIAGRSIVQPLA